MRARTRLCPATVSFTEWIAAALVVVNVALVARRSVWNYPVGIAGVALYATVFLDVRLYSDAALQVFFLVLNAYGWANWRRNREEAGTVVVERMTAAGRTLCGVGIGAATLGWGWLMHRFTDASLPWWDAGVAVTSVAAQWLQALRRWESWVLWIAVDLLSVGLYLAKELWPTAALYVLLTGIAAWGLADWLRARQKQAA
jgi:nicotinamide mononucleotide transporter